MAGRGCPRGRGVAPPPRPPRSARAPAPAPPGPRRPPRARRGARELSRRHAAGLGAPALGAARPGVCTRRGAGSRQLLRPSGVLAAAEEAAAGLAACPDLRGLVVSGPDAVLAAALARHGLPRLGARVPAPGTAVLVRLC